MEEEVGIKVTRLRRRLSVEAEDVKSPSQSTPTKKRGGRLATKPQLELIAENAPESAPKRTRKSTARDIAEPVEEKTLTPSRRSTRIRSNTSLVSETPDVAEDKGTPSRRSTRIKSNTSIIAETVQNVNSPRAKRAARRTSLAGSDNEAPITPARQTRRTRKDSASSVDKPVEPASKLDTQITDVIVEEAENSVKDSNITEKHKTESPIRKSPRLIGKARKSTSLDTENKEHELQNEKVTSATTDVANESISDLKVEQKNETTAQNTVEEINISMASKNLIEKLEEAPKEAKNNLNKTTTAIEEPQLKNNKRNRTKSWTTISVESTYENSFCSDSEATRKKNKNDTHNVSIITGSGDGVMNTSKGEENVLLNSSTLSNKKKKKRHEMSMNAEAETSINETSVNKSLNKSSKKLDAKELSKDVDEGIDSLNSSQKLNSSITQKFFESAPSGTVQSLVFIDDLDSNQGSIGKESVNGEDQLVPVVDHHLEKEETATVQQNNLSYEPMDIDETMPENVSLSTFGEKNYSINVKENRKSILNNSQNPNVSVNKSQRKSVISNITPEDSVDGGSKSQRNSISETIDVDVNVTDTNKSKRKSSISNLVSEDTPDSGLQDASRKSIVEDMDTEDSVLNKSNKSNRKSSISNNATEINADEDVNKSNRKSLNTESSNNESVNIESNKSIRKSSVSDLVNDNLDKSLNKSKRKSVVTIETENNTEEVSNDTSNKSTRKSALLNLTNDDNSDASINKSKRKSSVCAMVAEVSVNGLKTSIAESCNDDDMLNKSNNKSKRKSSIINTNDDSINKSSETKNKSLSLDKSETNKSTLVLSQLKDISENDVNLESSVPKDNNESSEQLSKSVNVPNVNGDKDTDKKNLSLTYSTSTPLQQKSLKKLGLQINSSIIAPNSATKAKKKNTPNKSKKEASILSQQEEADSSEEEGDSEDESKEESSLKKSQIIDDEAEEANDDYESGDSRDDDERDYEEQNEIVEKGETLDSEDEDEYSDDSDYEKGSFIVTSDEEDNDLLGGSGDDLSMSADELTMSAKSKKKFNERKIKEQKKASREMFEARHKLNESDKSAKSAKSKSKKNNRQRLDSSSSESDEEVAAQPKKNRRLRIDSSQDISVKSDADKSMKKKAKRLSESICEDNATNEKEITIAEESRAVETDPLILRDIVKVEPKTPQKELEISTVAVTDMNEVEEVNVNVDKDVSMIKTNQTADPLQATMAQDDEDGTENDSISENEEITQNYESILNNLNKSNTKKIKKADISLDLNKKTKQKSKEPIVDQLNLTRVKKSIKKKANNGEAAPENNKVNKSLTNKSTDKVDKEDAFSERSSDSIDMKLLFNEDSNDSELVVSAKKKDTSLAAQKHDEEVVDEFIPLKRTEAKTNILEDIDVGNKSKNGSLLNLSSNEKKKKRKSSQTAETSAMSAPEVETLGFFVDTTGTHDDDKKTADANTSIKNSAKKNKQKNNVSFADIADALIDDDSNDAPLEVSYRSEKANVIQNNEGEDEAVETDNSGKKKKKKNKNGLNSSQNVTDNSIIKNADKVTEKPANISISNADGSAKKKKKNLSESQIDQDIGDAELNVSMGSGKKPKQKSIPQASTAVVPDNEDNVDETNQEQVTKKRKRKSSLNQTLDELVKDSIYLTKDEPVTNNNQKKKRKISNNDKDNKPEGMATETQQNSTAVENTKYKIKAVQQEVDISDEGVKKNKKRKERDDDDSTTLSKVLKQNSFDKVHVPRLPANLLKQLDEKPAKDTETKETNVTSTSSFVVEETKKRRRNKPSNYLEESVYLNDDSNGKNLKPSIKKPKVLPFIPTASTSDSGFTTNFKVSLISRETQFVAQSTGVLNFKNDYLNKKRIKKMGTFEHYKRQRNMKISKF